MPDNAAKIVITAVDQTKAGIDSATRGIQTLSDTIKAIPGFGGIAASLAAFASAGALKSLIGDTIAFAASMDDLSETTGASVEKLSSLSRVAKVSGIEFDGVEKGLVRLSKSLAGMDDESKGAAHALAAIGLEITSLRELDPADAMKQVADALGEYADGAGKTALAQDLLGKSGAQLLPFLKDLAEEEKLQGKLTREQAAAAEELQKAWNRTSAEGGAWAKSIVIDMIPALASLIDFVRLTKEGIFQLGSSIAVVANDIATFAQVAVVAIGAGFTDEGQSKIKSLLDQRANFNTAANEDMQNRLGRVQSLRDKIDKTLAGGGPQKPRLAYTSRSPKEPSSGRGGRSGADAKAPGSVRDYDAILMERLARAIEQTDIVKAEELAATLEKLDVLAAAGLDPAIVQAVRDDLSGAAKKAADEVNRLNELLDATPTAQLEKLRDDMVFLTDALEAGKIAEEQYLEAVVARIGRQDDHIKKTLSDMDELALQAARNIQDAFADFLFDPFKDGVGGMLESFGVAVRRMIANAVAANLGQLLFGDIGKGNGIGGLVGQGLSWLSTLLPSADGNVFRSPGLSAYSGTIVDRPTYFPFARGIGLMGEAGPEAILPLRRGADGKLGVGAATSPLSITINMDMAKSKGDPDAVRRAVGQGAREALAAYRNALRYV